MPEIFIRIITKKQFVENKKDGTMTLKTEKVVLTGIVEYSWNIEDPRNVFFVTENGEKYKYDGERLTRVEEKSKEQDNLSV